MLGYRTIHTFRGTALVALSASASSVERMP